MEKIRIAMPQMGNDLFRKYMKSKYVQSLRRAGAEVCWIELEDPAHAVEEAIGCDGLLLPGGADIEPSLYGQERQPECGKANVVRDAAEPMLFRAFLEAKKPVFAICRGVQVMNVTVGGTLRQDIKGMQKVKHMDFRSRARSCHTVTVTEGTRLAGIVGAGELAVNSMHHQAVDAVAEGLVTAAVSEDGWIEALERPGEVFCLGVQWHPEHMSGRDSVQQKLFAAFVEACRG